jgi:hypothetical protein
MIPGVPKPEMIKGWEDVVRLFGEFSDSGRQWVFRGLSDAKWELETTLDRAVGGLWGELAVAKDSDTRRRELRRVLQGGAGRERVDLVERRLLREFVRQYHHFRRSRPAMGDVMEWLSLMRHYGAPCRLLDFTYSWFAALFFALDRAEGGTAVWAIDSDWADEAATAQLPRRARQALAEDPQLRREDTWKLVFWRRDPRLFVLPVNPYRLDPRLVVQQGVFLCPGSVSVPFSENLEGMMRRADGRRRVRRFVIEGGATTRRRLLERLWRMNMNTATLFPGLDGFSNSLWSYLVFAANFRQSAHFRRGVWK